MLTFLRKIRRYMIQSGNIRTYIFYAFGEIVLVVFGILIALQINNWNEGRKFAENEAYILAEILNNLQEDADQIKIVINRRTKAKTAIEGLLHSLRQPPGLDQIDPKEVAFFLTFERYYPLNNSFEMMKATGLKLSNKSLRSSISRYYDFEQKKVAQSIYDVEEVFSRIMQTKNPIRGNILQGNTGTNLQSELTLVDADDPIFREELLNELVPFQDNNRATLQKVIEFSEMNQALIEQVQTEIRTPRLRRYLINNG